MAGPDPGQSMGTVHGGSVFQRDTNPFQRETNPFQHDTGAGADGQDTGSPDDDHTSASSEADDPPLFSAPGHSDTSDGGHEAQYRSSAGEHTDQPDWHDHTDSTG